MAKQRPPWGPSNYWPPFQYVHNPDPQSTQQDEMWQGCCPSWLHEGVELARKLTEAVFSCGVIPSEWEDSFILSLNKGKGEALESGDYHGLKLTHQVMWLLEQVLESNIHEMGNIDEMQFGFVPGRGTSDAILVVCQLQQKYIIVNRLLYLAFIDLEKAFDHVPRKVLWRALRILGVKEWAEHVIQSMMYSNAQSCVQVKGQYSKEFGMRVGVHQGSVLSPPLFILVLEALSHEFCTGVLWEHLYADDLLFIADTQEECISRLKVWKAGLESKGLHVNMKKIKFLVSGVGHYVLKKSAKYPVLSAVVVLATTPFSAHGVCCGSIRCAVASLSDWWPTQTMSANGVMARFGPSMAELK